MNFDEFLSAAVADCVNARGPAFTDADVAYLAEDVRGLAHVGGSEDPIEVARHWLDAGLTHPEGAWMDAGAFDPDAAAELEAVGLTPEQCSQRAYHDAPETIAYAASNGDLTARDALALVG